MNTLKGDSACYSCSMAQDIESDPGKFKGANKLSRVPEGTDDFRGHPCYPTSFLNETF